MTNNVWFTADTHFGHTNIIKYCNRPFASVEEMDETLIANWNAVVGPTDTVWHLGDVCFAEPGPYLKRLNGRINLLWGNHDDRWRKQLAKGVETVADVHLLHWDGEKAFLSHYAHRVWPKSHHGVWHLYGHSHGTIEDHGRSTDVGVDCWGFTPVAFEVIRDRLAERPLPELDR